MRNILQEIKREAVNGILGNLPALIAGGAVLIGGAVEKLPIPGVAGQITKRLLRGTVAAVATAVTRAVATPAIPTIAARHG